MYYSLLIVPVFLSLVKRPISSQELVTGFEECFSTVWNVPSHHCTEHLGFEIPLDNYTIKHNINQSFHGSVMNIFYLKEGLWPRLTIKPYGQINGGIPQRGDLQAHLKAFEAGVNRLMPDVDNNGFAVIDFEEYIPNLSLIQGDLRYRYQEKSEAYVRDKYPRIIYERNISDLAADLFQKSTRWFMEETLKLGIALRPKAKWGYYGYPYCYRSDLDTMDCSYRQKSMNDNNMWLYEISTALYPSVYLYKNALPSDIDTGAWIHKVIGETRRIQQMMKVDNISVPAYVYMRFEYPSDDNDTSIKFLTKADTVFNYRLAFDMGMSGIIFWGSSTKIRERCSGLNEYLNDIVQPIARETNRYCNECRIALCNEVNDKTKCIIKITGSMEYIHDIYNVANSSNLYPANNEDTSNRYFCEK